MSNLIDHAKREFEISGYIPVGQVQEDGPNKWIQENVMQLLKVFADQGHSGSSAPYCVSMFEKLAMFEPLTPLTGDDSEWAEVSEGVFQNKRCSHVFKQADRFDGQAYDLEGKIFRDPGGGWYTNYHSAVPVEFPYYPEPVYVDETEDQHE